MRPAEVFGRAIAAWAYFKRAHSNYLVMVISFINFITITYTMLFVELLGFPKSITYFASYAAVFVALYFITAVLIGRWDYRRGTVPVEMRLHSMANPFTHDLASSLTCIAKALRAYGEGRREEAEELVEEAVRRLERWV